MVQLAKQAEETIAQLKAQIENIKQAAAISVSKPEEGRLRSENEQLKAKINALKMSLMQCEIKNGVKQVPIPQREPKLEATGADSVTQPGDIIAEVKPQVAKETKPKQEKKGKPEDASKKKGDEESKPKKAKVEKKDAAAGAVRPKDISRIDLRVGKIVNCKKHPDADRLYVNDVDLGEGQTRTILSGLVKHVPIEEMQGRLAVFMCNLKAAKMRGILSQGMIMCACSPEKVEILLPPPGAQIGDRVFAKDYIGEPDALMNPKTKIWKTVKPDLKTDGDKVAAYKGSQLIIEGKGKVVVPTAANTQIL
ncbi:aminoacyl tRNA synthase complex-interacting multifunctional protein 1-like isoform X2 [Mercenaria mercenaria]|nr:aminoacyl tRNA synthase complex-interacting multifunctional protein 1-like isoform X2 [Mercenaria mercenaria]XP_053399456.1 aminoacyl tRNA synthase complex-interacting multifunctional protein 1-like isoform X2 [Mercenaria mercenaria]